MRRAPTLGLLTAILLAFGTGLHANEVETGRPGIAVAGMVRDAATGAPLGRVLVRLEPHEAGGWQSTRSDSTGRFVLSAVVPGTYSLHGQLRYHASLPLEVTLDDSPRDEIILEMAKSLGLVLEVPPQDGPVADGIDVVIFDPDGGVLEATTVGADDDNRVRLAYVPAGDWIVWVRRGTSAWTRRPVTVPSQTVPVAFTEGANVCFTVIELADQDPLGTLFASLRDADGTPLPSLVAGDGRIPAFDGEGCIGGLWPGSWTLELRHEDGRAWAATVFVGTGGSVQLELR